MEEEQRQTKLVRGDLNITTIGGYAPRYHRTSVFRNVQSFKSSFKSTKKSKKDKTRSCKKHTLRKKQSLVKKGSRKKAALVSRNRLRT